MPGSSGNAARESIRSFWYTLLVVNLGLVVAGATYASLKDVSAAFAIPVIGAFLVQASIYLVPGFPQVRVWVENRFSPPKLALMTVALSLAPYLIYSLPTGVFAWLSLGKLAVLCLVVSSVFVLAPPRRNVFCWQDAAVMVLLAYPMISGLSTVLRDVYPSPVPNIPPLDVLGKIMLIPLGATAFLSLRRLQGSGYRLYPSPRDLWVGLKNYLMFLPVGMVVAIGIGFASWRPNPIEGWEYPLELLATALGIYAAVALPEELFFRGVLQNLVSSRLGNALAGQLIASVAFGLVHLPRGFPNWSYAVMAALGGWFYGRAYVERRSVVASSVTHTLVVVTWRYFFH